MRNSTPHIRDEDSTTHPSCREQGTGNPEQPAGVSMEGRTSSASCPPCSLLPSPLHVQASTAELGALEGGVQGLMGSE